MQAASRPLLRWLLYAAAGLVVLMALAVGTLRLLLPLAPDYQDDIRAWASEATGYEIRFEGISASWPLSGPQLSFYQVTLRRPGEAVAVLAAREFSAGLSLWQLVRDGRLAVGRVAVGGVRLKVERTADGRLLVQDRPLEELLPERSRQRTPEIDLVLTDIALTFLDTARDPNPVALSLDRLDAEIAPDRLAGEAVVLLPQAFGRRLDIEVEVSGPLPSPLALPHDWVLRLHGRGLALAPLWRYALGTPGPVRSADGDVVIDLEIRDGRLHRAEGEFSLENVTVAAREATTTYERAAARAKWQRQEHGWVAELGDLRLRREGRDSPSAALNLRFMAGDKATPERWQATAPFLRLDDLFPFVRALLAGTALEARLPQALSGELRGVTAELASAVEDPDRFSVTAEFAGLGITSATGETAIAGLSGSLAADADGGRLQLASRDVRVVLAQWFREPLEAGAVTGLLVWRRGAEGLRFLSDDVQIESPVIDIRSRVELVVPGGEASPVIDLKARASATEAREVLRYLPLRRFPPPVVEWLERAVVAGRVPAAEVEFRGPVRAFPYDAGEGVFRVDLDLQAGTLDFADGWPRVEDIEAKVVFDGVGMYSRRNTGRLGGLSVQDFDVRIPDLRRGILAISGRQRFGLDALLGFLRATPVATRIGPSLDRVTAGGPVDAAVRLALPVTRPAAYDLQVLLDPRGARLGWKGLPLDLRDLRGRVRLHNTRFDATGVRAVMLGEPVQMDLRAEPATDGQVTHLARLRGTTPVGRLAATFKLPLRRYLDGRLTWDATVTVSPRRAGPSEPIRVAVRSDLRGVGSALPAPLAKAPAVAWPMDLDLVLAGDDAIEVAGKLALPASFDLRLVDGRGGWTVERGAVRAGPGEVHLPERRGMTLDGEVGILPLDEWLSLGEEGGEGAEGSFRKTWRQMNLRAKRVEFAGQAFHDVEAAVKRGNDAWDVQVAGPATEGHLSVPFDLATRPLVLDMKRLWLVEDAPGGGPARTDPRRLPAVMARVADAALGDWRFGRLEIDVEKTAEGLVARRIVTAAPSFGIKANAAWQVGGGGDLTQATTRIEATLQSTDFRRTLEQLGFGPVMSGEQASVTAALEWPGGPRSTFLEQAQGRIGVEIRNGQVLDIEPGSGRLLGLLSVTALPRRLTLDFSDVFMKGFGFDTVAGQFRVGTGSAYTCNLGLTGPAADIGIVGRTGFAARDYDQFAVVRPQVSNVLTVGGAVLGGPVGGVTMLLISQLFRKPLSTLGESYYRVSGAWDQPAVVRVERAELDVSAFEDCEKEVEAALRAQPQAAPESPAPAGTRGQ
ncbi:MAG: TIGR02099 family protein [Gammaproteobacteria bacterium]|nr:TIGR02099 family protein [Gammaproteobacteria bacterium]